MDEDDENYVRRFIEKPERATHLWDLAEDIKTYIQEIGRGVDLTVQNVAQCRNIVNLGVL
jgi:hypothetical protein